MVKALQPVRLPFVLQSDAVNSCLGFLIVQSMSFSCWWHHLALARTNTTSIVMTLRLRPFTCPQASRVEFGRILGIDHVPGAPMWLCATCQRALRPPNPSLPAASCPNSMFLYNIPPELQGLSVMETRLISQVSI